jgi:hypothetical protein
MELAKALNWGAGVACLASIGVGTVWAGGNCWADNEMECCGLSSSVWLNCTGEQCEVNYPPYGNCCVDQVTQNIIIHCIPASPADDGIDNLHNFQCECTYVDRYCNSTNHVCVAGSTIGPLNLWASKPAGFSCVGQ